MTKINCSIWFSRAFPSFTDSLILKHARQRCPRVLSKQNCKFYSCLLLFNQSNLLACRNDAWSVYSRKSNSKSQVKSKINSVDWFNVFLYSMVRKEYIHSLGWGHVGHGTYTHGEITLMTFWWIVGRKCNRSNRTTRKQTNKHKTIQSVTYRWNATMIALWYLT